MLLSKSSQLFSISGLNALIGLMLGVASLVVSMAVMSGFESTLQMSVADTTGHLQILIKNQDYLSKETLIEKIKKVEPTFVAATRFGYIEAVIAHKGKLSGVILQGLDPEDIHQTLGLDKRLIEGKVELQKNPEDKASPAVIGIGLAKNMGLQVGQEFRIVLPLKNELDPNQFRRKIGVFRVSGVLDMGKYDYNQRMILTSLETTQTLAEIGDRYSGLLVKFQDIERARSIGAAIGRELGPGFVIRDWHDVNENLFEAVQIERIAIFFVILVIVIAAAFNIACTLYVNVVTRFSEIGLLKALGISNRGIIQIFSWQGLMIGFLGLLGGMILGLGLCFLFGWVEGHYGIIPGSIYKIDKINLSLRWSDALAISFATLMICFLATLFPALRGAALSPVEGLKNE